ncbi:MAG: sulfite exporter TauE/SafE family protein [Tolumonas sp.]|uniref:sulfite exporter TauE/SafE family protein n=1 Tax=uncultured Tolumonas sp. TaxID=263765 RepID=UPI002A0A8E84|nr:sulfite exporter TauE/SafE family protein [uncultured Tolumonas sp.]MDD2343687.1 sulfite exporter TauE/SafE family protein [Tolumonas sp.]MDD2841423.1 sulfite exporter TauE/SafE family protein [Tolumonas sp.]
MMLIGLIMIGLSAGLLSGIFGIGGGILIVPALMYLLGFSQKLATGTSLAILLPPVGIAAVWEYYKHGNVDLRAALIIALMVLLGSWLGARVATQLDAKILKTLFGVFLVILGGYVIFDAFKH